MDRWALITGASSGIGLELARCFARDGWNLVLTARNAERLRELAFEFETLQHVATRVIAADLSKPGAARDIFDAAASVEVSALVNNAGFGHYGEFADESLDLWKDMIQVNVSALVDLTHLFLPQMIERKQGIILNVGSLAAFQPGPTVNVYYATKAFVYSFSYALALELERSGVTVTVLSPGTTRTAFFDRANIHMSRPYPLMDAAFVAEVGYRAAMKGRRSATPGLVNKLISLVSSSLPSAFTGKMVAKIHAGRSIPRE